MDFLQKIRDEGRHACELISSHDGYGEAIDDCYEFKDFTLWAGNGEYVSQVNFCPVCGYEAKVKIKLS